MQNCSMKDISTMLLRPQRMYILVSSVSGNEKIISAGRPKKMFFTYFSEDLALPISFMQPIIAYF